MSSFLLSVTSTSITPSSIAIFVNPSKIAQTQHALYTDMFPLAWKVYNFQGGPDQMSFSDAYTPSYRAFVSGSVVDNVFNPSSSATVTSKAKHFDIKATSSGGAKMTVSPSSSPSAPSANVADISITNLTGQSQSVGVSDAAGNPYLAFDIDDHVTAEFMCMFQFAAVVVTDVGEGTMFKGETDHPYVTFMADDIKHGHVGLTFDGSILKVTGVQARNHPSEEKPFASAMSVVQEPFVLAGDAL